MSDVQNDVEQTALGWLVRVNDPAFADWDAWEAWLTEHPQHAEAYWRLAEAEAEVRETLAANAPIGVVRPVRKPVERSRRGLFAAAAAAAVVLSAGGLWTAWDGRTQTWVVETGVGEQRTVTLADGTLLHLDATTRLTLDRKRPRHAQLDQGRVLAEVVHDETRPFVVVAGDATLTDLGTAFDVTRLDDGVRVAVSEGVVRVDVKARSETLHPGDGVVARNGVMTRRATPVAEVAAWRGGRLVYDNERLAVVAQDLSRSLGRPVTVAPEMAERRFTGSVRVSEPTADLRQRLGLLLGVTVIEDGDGWRLAGRS